MMKTIKRTFLILIVVLLAVAGSGSIVVTQENEYKLIRQFGRVEELTRPIAVKLIDQVLVYEGGRVEIVFRYQAEYEMARQFLSIHTQGSEWREAV